MRWDENASGPMGTVASSDAQFDDVREESVMDLSKRKEVFDRLTLVEVEFTLYVWRGWPDVGVGSSSLWLEEFDEGGDDIVELIVQDFHWIYQGKQ